MHASFLLPPLPEREKKKLPLHYLFCKPSSCSSHGLHFLHNVLRSSYFLSFDNSRQSYLLYPPWLGNTSQIKLFVYVSVERDFLFFSCNIDTISFCNSLHLSIKDITEIVTLLILVLKLIAKLLKCIRYFRSGGQTVVRSNVIGGDGTTNNQMGKYQTSEC